MMNQQKTKKAGILKYSLIVPLALALVLSSNAEALVSNAKNIISKKTNESTESSASINSPAPASSKGAAIVEKKEVRTPEESAVQNSKPTQEVANNDKVYMVIEKMPQFPGGEKKLMNYIAKNLKYPVEAQKKGIQGKVIVQFIVTKSGKVENAKVIREIDPALEKEALRVVNSMPDWIPGTQNGEKVSVYYTLPIVFKLGSVSKSTVYKEHAMSEIKDNTKPIYFIDGKPATDIEVKALKPENIKSINVLKDASATALYGSRGADGVVEIILKK